MPELYMTPGSHPADEPAPEGAEPEDPHAHWAVPALERLRELGPASGGGGDDAEAPAPLPERSMPPMPEDGKDTAAMRKWLDHCSALRSMFGSGC
jgi:hypothetical protein